MLGKVEMKKNYRLKSPCSQCPYTLGLVHTLINPCPQCKEAGYQMFEQFQKGQPRKYPVTMCKVKKLIYQIKPPCPQCPYTLGLVHTVISPCPQCKEAGYQMFEQFQKGQIGNYPVTTAKD